MYYVNERPHKDRGASVCVTCTLHVVAGEN